MTEFSLSDVIGVCGTLMVGMIYLATQMRWINSDDLMFPLVNLIGSLLIGFSLYHDFNLAAALMEGLWVVISLLGIGQYLTQK